MSALEFVGVSKSFPGVQALTNVSFVVRAGTVHALCGENGAGKSTLLKVISGVSIPDSGQVLLNGQPISFGNTASALQSGIAVIYQELFLVPELTIAENIRLGHLPSTGGFVNRSQLWKDAERSLATVGLEVDPRRKVSTLSLAQRQMVEIAKALSRDAEVIAFDEPTSSLSSREVEQLFTLIGRLRAAGKIILYVSHRMDEVKQICDSCTVLRDGMLVETFEDLKAVEPSTIVSRMVGREIKDVFPYRNGAAKSTPDDPKFVAEGLQDRGLNSPTNLRVKEGEIVGIFGLVGSGRTELLKSIYAGSTGSVRLKGQSIPRTGSRSSIERGVVFIPEDRKHEGIIALLSVADNLNLSIRRRFATLGFVDRKREAANATEFIHKLRIKTSSLKTPIGTLSGGNQQKVILARWLSEAVEVILLDEPTRGVDVGAKSELYEIINSLADSGVSVILVSSELPEVMGVSDRILVMREGRLVGEVQRSEATEERLLKLALPEVAA